MMMSTINYSDDGFKIFQINHHHWIMNTAGRSLDGLSLRVDDDDEEDDDV